MVQDHSAAADATRNGATAKVRMSQVLFTGTEADIVLSSANRLIQAYGHQAATRSVEDDLHAADGRDQYLGESGAPKAKVEAADDIAAPDGGDEVLGTSMFGQRSRELMEMLKTLAEVGASHFLDVPRIVVVGDQSAGKSSIIQRICGVDLPRSEGTCTRCPMEVRLIAGAKAWSCTIKLRAEWGDASKRKAGEELERQFGPVLTNKRDVEMAIRRAQKAALNPSSTPDAFLNWAPPADPSQDMNEHSFTKTVVVLEIQGAGVNLTLVDLPGLIRFTEEEKDQSCVGMIRDLIMSYITRPRTVIVAVIQASVDALTQEAFKLAREVDPEKTRTIGVITKPDAIPAGGHKDWLQIMQGQKLQLKLGWHMVCNPSKPQLDAGITAEDATANELKAFSANPELASLTSSVGKRLGISNLVDALSTQLTSMLLQDLPDMIKKASSRLKEVRNELAGLPPALRQEERGARAYEWMQRVALDMKAVVAGKSDQGMAFTHNVKEINEKFAKSILASKPRFLLKDAQGTGGSAVYASYGADMDDEKAVVQKNCTVLSIKDVQGIIKAKQSIELPTFVAYPAVETVIQKFQGQWWDYVVLCLEQTMEELRKELRATVAAYFHRFPLLRHLNEFVEVLIQDKCEAARAQLSKLVSKECDSPFTLNNHYFTDSKKKYLGQMKAQLRPELSQTQADSLRKGIAYLAALPGMSDLTEQTVLGSLQAFLNNEQEEAINIMAATMAYFKVASKRFIDGAAMDIRKELLQGVTCTEAFLTHMDKHLSQLGTKPPSTGASTSASAGGSPASGAAAGVCIPGMWHTNPLVQRLMEEDPAVAQRRSELEAAQKALVKITATLSSY